MFDRLKGMALILYNNTDFAQAAVRETKGWKIGGNKIKVKKLLFIGCLCYSNDYAIVILLNVMSVNKCFCFNLARWILPVKRVRWHSTDLCRHQGKTFETSMKFLLNDGNMPVL